LLRAVASLPPGATGPLEALQAAGHIVLAERQVTQDPVAAITRRVAPPDAALQRELSDLKNGSVDPDYTLSYLPTAGLGAVLKISGSSQFQSWVLFQKRGSVTVPVSDPSSGLLDGCIRDCGSTGYLALIEGKPAALEVFDDLSHFNTTDLQWQQWLGGSQWGPAQRIRLRYAYDLDVSDTNSGNLPEPTRAKAERLALDAARRYMRDALALANSARRSGIDRARFESLLQNVPSREEWSMYGEPVWFPLQWNGAMALGGITLSHSGSHPNGPALDVLIWGAEKNEEWIWSIDVERRLPLLAALIPPNNEQSAR